AVASRSPATKALMPSQTYHGRTAGTMARRFRLLAFPGMPVVFARLVRLALLGERRAPVGVGFGKVRVDAQSLLEVRDRLGQPALLSERVAPVVAGEGLVGLGAHGLGVWAGCLGPR